MEDIKREYNEIVSKFDNDLTELRFHSDTSTLIQISAEFKDIKEVIQYFEASIDTLKTQNESLKDILRTYSRDIMETKLKLLSVVIEKTEFDKEMERLREDILAVPIKTPLHIRIRKYITEAISPKMLIIAIAFIIFISAFAYNPGFTKEIIREITPFVKKTK